jgi:NCAIR mutase (PurE)-related protein
VTVAADLINLKNDTLWYYCELAKSFQKRLKDQSAKMHRLISQRTRDALAAKKARGARLGNPKLVAAATKRDKVLRPILQKLAGQSLRAIAAELDRRGIKSWSGKPWNAVSVRNAMVRLGFQTTGGPS